MDGENYDARQMFMAENVVGGRHLWVVGVCWR